MHGIIFGVATSQIVRVKNAHQHKQFLGLNAGGYLWRRGEAKVKNANSFSKGDVVEVKLNKVDSKISWIKNTLTVFQC